MKKLFLLVALVLWGCSQGKRLPEKGEGVLVFPPSAIDPTPVLYRFEATPIWSGDLNQAIEADRIADLLMKILPISSRSCEELPYTLEAKRILEEEGNDLGIQVRLDDLPEKIARMPEEEKRGYSCNNGSTPPNSGNLIATIPGDPRLPIWNLSIHLDTNQTKFEGFRREGDRILPAPGTPLGADDKAGLAILVEILRAIRDQKIPHGEIRMVGLVAEEQSASGAKLIEGEAFKGDILISIDGTDPNEVGRAAPTNYNGMMTVRTETSHPFEIVKKRTVSACAVGSEILHEAGFRPNGQPPDHPEVVLHSYFTSCGVDEGMKTPKGEPVASYQFNTISPFWTASWQMRSLEGVEKAAEMAAKIRGTFFRVCQAAAKDRTPVHCEITNTEKPRLIGYLVPEDHPSVRLLMGGYQRIGGARVQVTTQQFGGFNGNHIKSRFGEEMLIIGTGADKIHTHEETASVSGMARVAQAVLAAMLESYQYKKVQ